MPLKLEALQRILAAAAGCEGTKCPPASCVCRLQAEALQQACWVTQRRMERGPKRFGFSEEEDLLILRAYRRGAARGEIAELLKRTVSAVGWRIHTMNKAGLLKTRLQRFTKMTQQQKAVRDFIKRFWDEHGYAPSYQIIAKECGIRSKSSVSRLILALEERGFITRIPNRARSVRVVEVQT